MTWKAICETNCHKKYIDMTKLQWIISMHFGFLRANHFSTVCIIFIYIYISADTCFVVPRTHQCRLSEREESHWYQQSALSKVLSFNKLLKVSEQTQSLFSSMFSRVFNEYIYIYHNIYYNIYIYIRYASKFLIFVV